MNYLDQRSNDCQFELNISGATPPAVIQKLDLSKHNDHPPRPLEDRTLFLPKNHTQDVIWLSEHNYLNAKKRLWWTGKQFSFKSTDETQKLSIVIPLITIILNIIIHIYI